MAKMTSEEVFVKVLQMQSSNLVKIKRKELQYL